MADTKTLAEMISEVVTVNEALGWYDKPVLFDEAMVLLHSEVSEALEAWRQWGFRDMTGSRFPEDPSRRQALDERPPKPEGVGSEFADILIRLLDYAWRFGLPGADLEPRSGMYAISESFPANLNLLHRFIAGASMAWETDADRQSGESPASYGYWFRNILVFLRQLCKHYDIDLQAEYVRKLQYNRSRPYRHGGKRI
jgi:hypothetical protein